MLVYPFPNKTLSTLSLLIIPIAISIIYISSFEFNFYLYLFLVVSIFLLLFTKHNIKAWFWLSLFLIIYSFPHFTEYYFFEGNNMITAKKYNYIINESTYNLEAIRLLLSFILSLVLGSNLFSLFNVRLKIEESKKKLLINIRPKMSIYKKIILFSLMFFLAIYSISVIDFSVQSQGYSLGGFNILFGVCYILHFFLLYQFLNIKDRYKYFILILVLYSIILGFFGVRQVLFWLFVSLLIAYFFKSYIANKKINWIRIFFYLSLVTVFFAIILAFRNQKLLDATVLSRTGEMIFFGLRAETNYTFYNMFSSIHVSENEDLFFMKSFRDTLYYLIPRPILPNKYEFITLYQFIKSHDLSPFGSSFYLGELKLTLRYDVLILLFGLIISFASEFFLLHTLKKKDILLLTLYISFLVMVFIYPIRGPIGGGVKVFIQYNLIFYIFLKYRFIIK